MTAEDVEGLSVKALKAALNQRSIDHAHCVEKSELKALLHGSGADASDAQGATMLADNDTDGDGVISFSEFVGIVRAGEASEAAHAGAAGGGVYAGTRQKGQDGRPLVEQHPHYTQIVEVGALAKDGLQFARARVQGKAAAPNGAGLREPLGEAKESR